MIDPRNRGYSLYDETAREHIQEIYDIIDDIKSKIGTSTGGGDSSNVDLSDIEDKISNLKAEVGNIKDLLQSRVSSGAETPEATEDRRGQIFITQNDEGDDSAAICLMTNGGSYYWKSLTPEVTVDEDGNMTL